MTEKELRKLNRYQLLELLVIQTRRADQLQEQLEKTKAEFVNQDYQISQLGSLAEVSLQLSGIFDSAQAAADLYLESAKKQAAEIISNAEKRAQDILQHAENEVLYQAIMKERVGDLGVSEE